MFEFLRKKREIQVDDLLLQAIGGGGNVTAEEAMKIPAVSSAVNFLADTVAMIPIKLYTTDGESIREETKDHRPALINADTRDTLDGFQFKKIMVKDYLLEKGAYAFINRQGNNVLSLHYVDPIKITINKNNDPIFKSYNIVVGGKRYEPFEFIKLLRNTKDGASGVGVVAEVNQALKTAYSTMLYELGLVQNGGVKKGFLKARNRLSKEEMDALKKAWSELYSNDQNNVIVLNNGLEFQDSASSSVELQLNQSKTTLQAEINQIFHIGATWQETFKMAIAPILDAIERALNRDLLLEVEKPGMFFAFDTKDITKADLTERFNAYKTAKDAGFMTINEIRYLENMEEIKGMDVVNVGLSSVLYNVETEQYYTPNTNAVTSIDGNALPDTQTTEEGGTTE